MKTLFPKAIRHRRLQLEHLEERQMLSITQADFDIIRAQNPDLNLSANLSSYNQIDITTLTAANLRTAISTASSSAGNDLIILRTSSGQNNTISLGGTELGIGLNSSGSNVTVQGGITIVSFGDETLTLDAGGSSRVFNIGNH